LATRHVASWVELKDCPDLLYHIWRVFTIKYPAEGLTNGKHET
jgi:hypothetical protein